MRAGLALAALLLSSRAPATCVPNLSADQVAADPRFYPDGGSDIILRQLCAALAAKDPARCDVAEKIRGNPENGRNMCRRLYDQARLAASLMSGAEDAKVDADCRRWCRLNPTLPPEEKITKVCALLVKRDVDAACSEVTGWKGHGYSKQKCLWEFRSLLGDADVCRNWPRPASDVCDATAAYKRAAKKGGSCGSDPVCRALKGEGPAACAALDRRLSELTCPVSQRSPEPKP